MLEFSINGQIITRNDEDPIVRDSQNYVIAYFLGDEEWRSHGTVTAVFKGADGQTFNMILAYDPHYGHSCLVPWEVLTQPWFEVSAFCGNLITANTVKVFTIKSGYDSTRDSRIPTPDVYNQIIEQLNRIEDEVDPDAVKAFVDEYLEGKDFVTEADVETIVATYISEHQSQLKTSVTVTPILASGTKIAEINVDGTTKEIFAPTGGGSASSLSDLSDTSISSPSSGDVLVYDGEKWENAVFDGFERKKIYTPLDLTFVDGYYVNHTNGQPYELSTAKYCELSVAPDEHYRIVITHEALMAVYAFYTSNGTFISAYPTSNPPVRTTKGYNVVVPEHAARMRCSGLNTMPLYVYKVTEGDEYEIKNIHDILYGKKWFACGDSFTAGDFTRYTDSQGHVNAFSDAFDEVSGEWKTYPYWIGKRTGIIFDDKTCASGGNAFTNVTGATRPFSLDTAKFSYVNIPSDCDYITLSFGLNELSLTEEQIGTSADTTNETLWGAYYVVLNSILTANPTVKIGIIISDGWMCDNTRYYNALKGIAKYYRIPILDLSGGDDKVPLMINSRGTVSAMAKTLRGNAMAVSYSGNYHPTPKGHEYRSTVIENFLRTL